MSAKAVAAMLWRIVGGMANFAMTFVVARLLGAEQAGLFFLALAITTVGATFARFGLDNAVLRFVSVGFSRKDWSSIWSVTKVALIWTCASSLVVCIVLFFSSPIIARALAGDAFEEPLRWMSLGVITLSGCTLLGQALQGTRKLFSSVVASSIGIPFGVCASALIFRTAEGVAIGYVVAGVITFVVAWTMFSHSAPRGEPQSVERLLLKSCIPLWMLTLADVVQQWGGQLIASAFVPPQELAQFAAAQRTAMLVSFILVAVNWMAAPQFAALHSAKNILELRRVAKKSTTITLTFSLPLIVIMLSMSNSVMSIFGGGFSEGGAYLKVLAVGQFVHAATGPVGYLLIMTGHERDARNSNMIAVSMFFASALLLVPIYGGMGAAYSTAGSLIVQKFCNLYFVRRRLGFFSF